MTFELSINLAFNLLTATPLLFFVAVQNSPTEEAWYRIFTVVLPPF